MTGGISNLPGYFQTMLNYSVVRLLSGVNRPEVVLWNLWKNLGEESKVARISERKSNGRSSYHQWLTARKMVPQYCWELRHVRVSSYHPRRGGSCTRPHQPHQRGGDEPRHYRNPQTGLLWPQKCRCQLEENARAVCTIPQRFHNI